MVNDGAVGGGSVPGAARRTAAAAAQSVAVAVVRVGAVGGTGGRHVARRRRVEHAQRCGFVVDGRSVEQVLRSGRVRGVSAQRVLHRRAGRRPRQLDVDAVQFAAIELMTTNRQMSNVSLNLIVY